jgi:hypothetical protein
MMQKSSHKKPIPTRTGWYHANHPPKPPISREEADRRGKFAENVIEKMLKEFVSQGLIQSYIRSKRHSDLDNSGIDFLITTLEGKEFPLQVKYSNNHNSLHNRKYGTKIPLIHLKGNVREKLLKIIENYRT